MPRPVEVYDYIMPRQVVRRPVVLVGCRAVSTDPVSLGVPSGGAVRLVLVTASDSH
jgi:hypothetical protein